MLAEMKNTSLSLFTACLLLVGGCSSQVPELIRTAPAGDIRVDEVQQKQGEALKGNQVRWGGHIISVHNHPESTLIEVLSRKLNKDGKPISDSKSQGRFMARMPGFLEPEEYPKDRLLTVTGKVVEVMQQRVGSYPYPYPVVEVEAHHLWPKVKSYPYHPYYHDPFYDPFFYPYPYWRRYPYWY